MHIYKQIHTYVYMHVYFFTVIKVYSRSIPIHVRRAIPEVRISVKGEPKIGRWFCNHIPLSRHVSY